MTRVSRFFAGFLVASLLAGATVAGWAWYNQPQTEAPWPPIIQGFAFSPYRADQDATKNEYPTVEQLDEDLALLAGKTHAIRTYQVRGTFGDIPALAAKHDLNVALGIWVDTDAERTEEEVRLGIALANKHRNVVRVIVGNEAVGVRNDVNVEQMIALLDHVRANTRK